MAQLTHRRVTVRTDSPQAPPGFLGITRETAKARRPAGAYPPDLPVGGIKITPERPQGTRCSPNAGQQLRRVGAHLHVERVARHLAGAPTPRAPTSCAPPPRVNRISRASPPVRARIRT
ncbi:hypothetical protein ACWD0G_24975, partial [Streptomyces goshikiensis]